MTRTKRLSTLVENYKYKNTNKQGHLKGNLKRDPGNEVENDKGMRTQSVRK